MFKPKDASIRLPPWLDHFNARDLQALFRCSVAAWVATLLIFIGPSLSSIGTATFFASLVIFIVPPSGIVFVFLLAAFTLLLGITLAWAWGVIVMKAALAARPEAQTNARSQALQQAVTSRVKATGENVAGVQQEFIFDGFMLDARVSVIYFVLMCLFIYFLARLRAKNPKFALLQVFGTIIADLFLVIAPSLPSFNGLLARTLVEPAAIGVGLGLASSILFFPQSTSSTVLFGMEGVLRLLKRPLDYTASSLSKETDHLSLDELNKVKGQAIAAYKAMEPAFGFLPLDFSVGPWNAQDIQSLKKPVQHVLLAILSLLEFHIARVGGHVKLEKLRGTSEEKLEVDEKGLREIGRRQLTESMELVQAIQSPESESLRSETVRTLRESSSEILPACQEAVTTVAECIYLANSNRWLPSRSREKYQKLLEQGPTALEALRAARSSFAKDTTERLIQTHADVFDEDGKLKPMNSLVGHSVRGIMIGMVFEEHVLAIADALDRLLAHTLTLLRERSKTQLWFPTSIRYATAWVFRRTAVVPIPEQSSSSIINPDDSAGSTDEAQHLLRISRGYRARQRRGLAKAVLGTYHWFISAEGLYALRMVIVTIALAIPAVIPTSAGFYYREKGIWGLIMAQTTMLVYMADFMFSVVCRTIGTVIGGVLGLVAWYIGSGHGPGNPYGLAAIVAAVIVVMMWARLFFSPALLQGSMMSTATFVLTVGYSYDDTHIPSYGNPGVGYSVFWRRLALVLVGVAAATVVQFFPRPPSATRHVCRSLSKTIRSLSDHYALLLTCWGHPEHRETGQIAHQISIDQAEKLISLNGPIGLLRFEFSSSLLDSHTLKQVQSLCHELNQNIGRLLFLSASLPLDLQNRLARIFGILDHKQVGDAMAVLGVIEQSLKTGDPLPEVLPTPLLKRSYEYWLHRPVELRLGVDLIQDENYRKFCVAVSSYVKFLGVVDELVLVVKKALGEVHVVSREVWSDVP